MFFKTTDAHEALRAKVRQFAENEVKPIAFLLDQQNEFPDEAVKKLAELGLMGIPYPKEYGGAGLDVLSYAIAVEELSRVDGGTGVILSAHVSLGSWPIFAYGTEEQKQKYLVPLVKGEKIGAFGLTEPNAGSDAASMTTRAVEDGDSYILNGRKCFITMAPIADQCIVYAKTDPEKGAKGITCFMVDMNLPGVSCGRHEEKMGQRGVPVSDVVLEDVRVPKDCVIGEVGMGFINAMKTLSVGRVGVSSMCLGMAQEAIDLAVNHTKNRVQFGKPLAKMQALQFMMADMETKLNAARLLTYNAAYLLDTRQPADKAASMAKYYSAEAAIEIVNKSLQLHGGYGYSREYEIERIYRDVRVCSIYEGSSQVQQMVISGQLLK